MFKKKRLTFCLDSFKIILYRFQKLCMKLMIRTQKSYWNDFSNNPYEGINIQIKNAWELKKKKKKRTFHLISSNNFLEVVDKTIF